MNYKIVKNESQLREFIDWLPDGHFYVSLIARKKYCQLISSNNQQLRRFVSTKKHLFQKIKQLECPIGSYAIDDFPIPEYALALYITINPRSLWKASCNGLKKLAETIANGDKSVDPLKMMTNIIQTSSEDKKYLIFDIDDKNAETLQKALDIVGRQCYIVTRGGYHVLVNTDKIKQYPNNWYNDLKAFSDIAGDEMSPVPGTTQGNFIPFMMYDN